jgi:hypothetical protein
VGYSGNVAREQLYKNLVHHPIRGARIRRNRGPGVSRAALHTWLISFHRSKRVFAITGMDSGSILLRRVAF